jgi:hypothetical protein
LYLRGNLNLHTEDGTLLLHDTRMALCRCGASKNKPLCDGSHHEIDFRDAGLPGTGGGAPPTAQTCASSPPPTGRIMCRASSTSTVPRAPGPTRSGKPGCVGVGLRRTSPSATAATAHRVSRLPNLHGI